MIFPFGVMGNTTKKEVHSRFAPHRTPTTALQRNANTEKHHVVTTRHNSSVLSLYWQLLKVVVCDVSQINYAIYNFSVQIFFSLVFALPVD